MKNKKFKKVLLITTLIFLFSAVFMLNVSAETTDENDTYEQIMQESGAEDLIENLSDEAKEKLKNLGITGTNPQEFAEMSFQTIISEIIDEASKQAEMPLKTALSILGIIILSAVLGCFKDSFGKTMQNEVLNVVITLAIVCTLVVPVSSVITLAVETITNAANFMLCFLPVMAIIMVTSGNAVSGSAYYSAMTVACQAVVQISSRIITPMLNVFLGISVIGTIIPDISLAGLTEFLGKTIKWLLGILMLIFTAVLGMKTFISASADTVSSKAIKFSISSFVPVVGASISEAYNTVQSSVVLLKSGVGILAVVAVIVIFLPSLLQVLLWILTVNVCKSVGEIMGLQEPCKLLSAVSVVLTTLISIILCIMVVLIISAAMVITIGGGAA